MKIISLVRAINTKFVAGLLIGAFSVGVGLHTKESKAVTTGLTGSCGMLFNKNFAGLDANYLHSTGVMTTGLVLVNFDTGKLLLKRTVINGYGDAVPTQTSDVSEWAFTQTPTSVAGAYDLTIAGNTPVTMTVLAVNSGNTLLVQLPSVNGSTPGTGVCQKV